MHHQHPPGRASVRTLATLHSLVGDNSEKHMDSEELRVLKLAETQVRDVLRSVLGRRREYGGPG